MHNMYIHYSIIIYMLSASNQDSNLVFPICEFLFAQSLNDSCQLNKCVKNNKTLSSCASTHK